MGIGLSARGTGPSYIILGKFDGAPFLATVLVAKMGADNILKHFFMFTFSNICSIFITFCITNFNMLLYLFLNKYSDRKSKYLKRCNFFVKIFFPQIKASVPPHFKSKLSMMQQNLHMKVHAFG